MDFCVEETRGGDVTAAARLEDEDLDLDGGGDTARLAAACNK